MITQMLARWLAAQIMQRIMGKVTGYAEVARNAAVAGSGAYAAIAAIPYVGPFAAPGAAATAYAGAMSFAASIPAAKKGWDIPAGLNPITQLHEKEMVLPAEHADAIRGMTGNAQQMPPISISAIDARGVAQLFRDNGSELVKILRAHVKQGA